MIKEESNSGMEEVSAAWMDETADSQSFINNGQIPVEDHIRSAMVSNPTLIRERLQASSDQAARGSHGAGVQLTGQLWCQQGSHKLYSPTQCPAQTLECFKFVCDAEEAEFVARGCGVSLLTTAAGLPNESCHQAIGICEHVGGIGSCFTCNDQHMCNTTTSFSLLTVLLLIVLVRIH